jgi:hypothetical protein
VTLSDLDGNFLITISVSIFVTSPIPTFIIRLLINTVAQEMQSSCWCGTRFQSQIRLLA